MDGRVEAMPAMAGALARVRHGETLTIMDDGRPVATLGPAARLGPLSEPEVQRWMAEMRAFRDRHALDGLTWRDLRDEGRR